MKHRPTVECHDEARLGAWLVAAVLFVLMLLFGCAARPPLSPEEERVRFECDLATSNIPGRMARELMRERCLTIRAPVRQGV